MAARRHRYSRRKRNDSSELIFVVLVIVAAIFLNWNPGNLETSLFYLVIILITLALAVIAAMIWKHQREQRKLRALDIAAIDTMDPLEFEKYVARLLVHRGFSRVRLTERYDYGVDVLAYKDGTMWGVQVKRYSNMVKAEAVRQVFTALVRYKCDRAMVITNSTFSRPARELAADNNCVLIERDELSEWIANFQDQKIL
jgi:restriction system protein